MEAACAPAVQIVALLVATLALFRTCQGKETRSHLAAKCLAACATERAESVYMKTFRPPGKVEEMLKAASSKAEAASAAAVAE